MTLNTTGHAFATHDTFLRKYVPSRRELAAEFREARRGRAGGSEAEDADAMLELSDAEAQQKQNDCDSECGTGEGHFPKPW